MNKKRQATPKKAPALIPASDHLATAVPAGYEELLQELKARIRHAQIRAALSVNRDLVLLYWQIGRDILQRQRQQGWGAKVIDRLSSDLRRAFPEMKGFSPRNLKYMRAFADAWPDEQFVQEVLAQITWYHNLAILEKVSDPGERDWYIRKTIEHGWSRNILALQIETRLFHRQGQAVTNFTRTLPPAQSELAAQLLKDPYNFDFLTLHDEAVERDLEQALVKHIRQFLLELGVGFAFVGNQYWIEVGGEDFYIDLLFYHLRLRAFVVIDLKMKSFQPADAGQMNFYLSAVDDLLRHADDQPSVGIILCKTKNRFVAEYALRGVQKPIGVSDFQLTTALPEQLQGSFPAIEELEAELSTLAATAADEE